MKRYLLLISMLAAFVAESAAREVYRLNDDWTFYFRSENSADDARNITLPHTWNLDALAGNSGVPAHDGQLHAPALHSCRLGVEAALPALRRRADRGRRLRQRLSCRRAPRRFHGLHVRNHRPREVRRREPLARSGQQHFPKRRAAHFDRAERLRRHLPRRRPDPDRQGSRIAYGLGNRRALRRAGVGGRRRGRGPCGGLCLPRRRIARG